MHKIYASYSLCCLNFGKLVVTSTGSLLWCRYILNLVVYCLFARELMKKVSSVTAADLNRIGKRYVSILFDPKRSNCAVCCNPSKVDEISERLKE